MSLYTSHCKRLFSLSANIPQLSRELVFIYLLILLSRQLIFQEVFHICHSWRDPCSAVLTQAKLPLISVGTLTTQWLRDWAVMLFGWSCWLLLFPLSFLRVGGGFLVNFSYFPTYSLVHQAAHVDGIPFNVRQVGLGLDYLRSNLPFIFTIPNKWGASVDNLKIWTQVKVGRALPEILTLEFPVHGSLLDHLDMVQAQLIR